MGTLINWSWAMNSSVSRPRSSISSTSAFASSGPIFSVPPSSPLTWRNPVNTAALDPAPHSPLTHGPHDLLRPHVYLGRLLHPLLPGRRPLDLRPHLFDEPIALRDLPGRICSQIRAEFQGVPFREAIVHAGI